MGFVADKEILQHIVYDFADVEMMDLLRPSIEEAAHVTSEEVALDWIARRVTAAFTPKAKRIAYARDVLQKELLPHIGIGEYMENKKAYFLGYMVHRMLLVALGRQPQSDRDSYAVKRLRMAGPLMADLFRCGPADARARSLAAR
jgi:DNA-directed RNA polymerase II subunit RPB2